MASSLSRSISVALLFFVLWFPLLRADDVPPVPRRPHCSAEETSALLEFKESFMLANVSRAPVAYPKTVYWKMGQNESVADCCKWEGVGCRNGHVISLDLSSSYLYGSIDSTSSLFRLVHLRRLNLADNFFNYSRIPSGFGKLARMAHLNLSYAGFLGQVPLDILSLTRLVSLDLGNMAYPYASNVVELKNPGLENLVRNLTNLQVLNLNYVTIPERVPSALANLSSLRQLFLENSGIYGTFPSQVFNLPSLEAINLLSNVNLTGHLPEFNTSSPLKGLALGGTTFSGKLPDSIGNLQYLEVLILNSNSCNFTGSLPRSIGNLENLNYLDIGGCKFSGSIPSSMGNLTGLQNMLLGQNQFAPQQLSSLSWLWKMTNLTTLVLVDISLQGQIPASVGNLSQITELVLRSNQLEGMIPSQISNLTLLQHLDLGMNKLSGPLLPWIANMTRLKKLNLASNGFEGEIPLSISQMENLVDLALAKNSLTGNIELETFLKLKNLEILQLSFNKLSIRLNTTTQIGDIPQLLALGLSSCDLREFPRFLQGQNSLEWIDLSDNNIHGQVPGWMWNLSNNMVVYMNLSANFLTGSDSDPPVLSQRFLQTLDLSYNKFKRPVPAPPKSIETYLIPGNELEGEFPLYLCELSELVALDFSFNNMTGTLPDCLGYFSENLSVLNLQSNGFHGRIPEFSESGKSLVMIDMSDNWLEGKLPRSLADCTRLEFIGLANNQIKDTLPHWLMSLPDLKVLILHSNKLGGSIDPPGSEPMFQKLRIIDVSNNGFSGSLPGEYFQRWTSMETVNSSTNKLTYLQQSLQPARYLELTYYGNYPYTMTVNYKGIKLPYPKISDVLTLIDFSSNLFEGTIPDTVGQLKGLQGLNFSNNLLTGHIPASLGNLTVLESLDLSNNKLSGQIPQSLAGIAFLSTLNLSNNDLTGQIPSGRQFDSFLGNSFEGNPGLCGKNIPKKCHFSGGDGSLPRQPPNTHDGNIMDELPKDVFWMIVAMGCGSGLIVGWVLGEVFASWKREWFVQKGRRGGRRRRVNRRN